MADTWDDDGPSLQRDMEQLKLQMRQIHETALRTEELHKEHLQIMRKLHTEQNQHYIDLGGGRTLVAIVFALCFAYGLWISVTFWISWGLQDSAPQQAAVAAYAAARMVIAYALARSVEKFVRG